MTYISIEDEVNRLAADGFLIPVEAGLPSVPPGRRLFVSPDVAGKLTGPWSDRREEVRWGITRADLQYFVAGEPITLPPENGYADAARVSRLSPPPEEVWEVRCRDPRPGIRVFGRFAAKDLFIALECGAREPLGPKGSRAWAAIMAATVNHWTRLFPMRDPIMHGRYPDDYLLNPLVI